MTVCNMTIEGGGRAGMIAPDETTFAWLAERGVEIDPRGATLRTDDGATFDREIVVDATALSPQVTWGTTPEMVVGVTDAVPEPQDAGDERALEYMALAARHADDRDPRSTASSSARARTAASATCAPRPRSSTAARCAATSTRWSSPARSRCKAQAEAEGLDEVFRAAGFDWRARGLLDVPGHEPRRRGAGRARRLDLEPQLRGPPGPRRPQPPRLARRWPPRPPSRGTSSTSGSGQR